MEEQNCFDTFLWKCVSHFEWYKHKELPWLDFSTHINTKIVTFPYSTNIMTALYDFIIIKTRLLRERLFLENHNLHFSLGPFKDFDVSEMILDAILKEIVSQGKDAYDIAIQDNVYQIYHNGDYTITGGLCSIFTSGRMNILEYNNLYNFDSWTDSSLSDSESVDMT